ncbi:hypothetical protein [Actinoplanes sp. URMC 104]|uniref:hypothetical protein n=1 Tax=Actinoplanes sp. URMC 104 TaxID=3423409 RepID=UPI003F1B8282
MFETLDDVSWPDLTHAYGSAADVPAHLRALLSADAEARTKALSRLDGSIVHQGTRYDSSAPAATFLLEAMAEPATPGRAELLTLLVALAIGSDDAYLPDGDPRRLQADVELRAYAAVAAGVPLFIELLGSPVKKTAAYALGWFPAQAELSVPALEPLLADADPAVAATAALSLGLLGAADARPLVRAFDDARPLARAFDDARPLVRGAAAVALARQHGRGVPRPVVDELLRWSGHGEPADVPHLGGDLPGLAALSLRLVMPDESAEAFDLLLRRLASVTGPQALPVTRELLRRAFPTGPVPSDAFTDRQHHVVRALAAAVPTWHLAGPSFGDFVWLAGSYGLPWDADDLHTLARTTHPGGTPSPTSGSDSPPPAPPLPRTTPSDTTPATAPPHATSSGAATNTTPTAVPPHASPPGRTTNTTPTAVPPHASPSGRTTNTTPTAVPPTAVPPHASPSGRATNTTPTAVPPTAVPPTASPSGRATNTTPTAVPPQAGPSGTAPGTAPATALPGAIPSGPAPDATPPATALPSGTPSVAAAHSAPPATSPPSATSWGPAPNPTPPATPLPSRSPSGTAADSAPPATSPPSASPSGPAPNPTPPATALPSGSPSGTAADCTPPAASPPSATPSGPAPDPTPPATPLPSRSPSGTAADSAPPATSPPSASPSGPAPDPTPPGVAKPGA